MSLSVVTIGDMRRLEQAAVEAGTPYAALMERAGKAVADTIRVRFDARLRRHVLILCGNGNNGGDGFVVARHLCKDNDCRVTVLNVCGEPKTALAKDMLEQLDRSFITVTDDLTYDLSDVTLVVDAVYGIGFRGALPDHIRKLFDAVAKRNVPVAAVDIPSGMNADNGLHDKATLSASLTVTFTAKKPAMITPSVSLCGELVTADVGIPAEIAKTFSTSMTLLEEQYIKTLALSRPADSHKGTFGSLLSVCGSYGMAGAAMLSGKAALRSGVGLLHMAIVDSIYPIVASQIWEAVYHPLPQTDAGAVALSALPMLDRLAPKATAVLVGCGLSQNDETTTLIKDWLPTLDVPVVLDADGLNLFSSHIVALKAIKAPLVLTPHPAEAARLLGVSVEEIERDRPLAAKRLAYESGAVVVLKGHRTLIASPQGDLFINVTGNSGMATGGSGDVLGGMIAALCARGVSALNAALCGVYWHAAAGDAAAKRYGETAMLPTDMIDELGSVLSQFERRE